MLQIKAYIAFVLLLVFNFPVVYLQVHMHEHVHGPEVATDGFQKEHHSCGHTHCYISYEDVSEIDFEFSFGQKETAEEACPICEYEFTNNQQPKAFQLYVLFQYFQKNESGLTHDSFVSSCVLTRSSRAPPFIA